MKIGAYARSHIAKILSYSENNPKEILHLMDAVYSKRIFNPTGPSLRKPSEYRRSIGSDIGRTTT